VMILGNSHTLSEGNTEYASDLILNGF
jgi:hypothetical protein